MLFVSEQSSCMANPDAIVIEVAYAEPDQQKIIQLEVTVGTTIAEAIRCSGILTIFPDIDLTRQKVGIFSQMRDLSDLVAAGDRIEIYRPLIMEPKEARRLRVKKKQC